MRQCILKTCREYRPVCRSAPVSTSPTAAGPLYEIAALIGIPLWMCPPTGEPFQKRKEVITDRIREWRPSNPQNRETCITGNHIGGVPGVTPAIQERVARSVI